MSQEGIPLLVREHLHVEVREKWLLVYASCGCYQGIYTEVCSFWRMMLSLMLKLVRKALAILKHE